MHNYLLLVYHINKKKIIFVNLIFKFILSIKIIILFHINIMKIFQNKKLSHNPDLNQRPLAYKANALTN